MQETQNTQVMVLWKKVLAISKHLPLGVNRSWAVKELRKNLACKGSRWFQEDPGTWMSTRGTEQMRRYGKRTKLRSSGKAGAVSGAQGESEEVVDAAAARRELRVNPRQTQ